MVRDWTHSAAERADKPPRTPLGKEGLICAYLFDGKGRGKVLGWEGIRAWKPEDGVIWVHVNLESPEAKRWVERESQLEELIGDAILAQDARPRATRHGAGTIAVLRGVNMNPGADPEDMVAIRMWLEPQRIVSAARRRLIAVEDLGKWLENGEGPNDAGEFAVNLAWRLIERMDPVMDTLTEAVDEIEDAILSQKEDPTYRARLADLRRMAIVMRRHLAPQRDAMIRLAGDAADWMGLRQRSHMREINDRLTYLIEELDEAREHATVAQEELIGRQSDQMNRTMYKLTIVATIFLPLGFLTGLLGINVGGIPGSEDPHAFLEFSIILVAIAVIEMVGFPLVTVVLSVWIGWKDQ